jgi:hypothetical protein
MAELRDCAVLRAGPVTSVAEAVDRLTEIRDGTTPVIPGCGIAEFSDLYLTITRGIQGHLLSGTFFADNQYLARLDVAFANRYLDALRAWASGGAPPEVWQMLFGLPPDGEITALQLAGAGVNAHINLDLAVAVVDTGREMGDATLATGARRSDFTKVNDVFAEEMDTLLRRFVERRAGGGEKAGHTSTLGRMLTAVVAIARRHAWEDAEELWPMPRHSEGWMAKEHHMDAMACWLGQRLLVDLPG